MMISAAATGTYLYFNQSANNAAIFAQITTPKDNGSNQVELYFPLEKFLALRSTPDLRLQLVRDQVHVRLMRKPFSALPLTLTVDILGTPTVWQGYFMLKKVSGYVDHIPIPESILFSAIAAEGGRYGVRVNAARDTLFIDHTNDTYRLIGYDTNSHDLIIAMPVSTVLKAARDQTAI